MKAPLPDNETDRLAALYALDILDSAPEQDFDDIVGARLHRLRHADVAGHPGRHRPAVVQGPGRHRPQRDLAGPLLLRARHPRPGPARGAGRRPGRPRSPTTRRSDMDGGIRFYAGAPLITTDGYALGTLCVIDNEPRKLDVEQLQALRALARQVTSQMELRRHAIALANTTARLQELERRKDDLAGLVGGELRAPLRLISAYLDKLGSTGLPRRRDGRAGRPGHGRAHPRLPRPAPPPDHDGRGGSAAARACTCGRST